MSENLPLLSVEIIARREARGLSQAELAEKLDVDTVTVHRYERGKARPRRRQTIRALMETLDLSQRQLDALFRDWCLNHDTGPTRYRLHGIEYLRAQGMDENELVERILDIDMALLPEISRRDLGTSEQWAPIFHASPGTWRLLVRGGVIVGYWQYLIVSPQTLTELLSGATRDSDIRLDDLVYPDPFTSAGSYAAYIPMIGIEPASQSPAAAAMLFQSLLRHFEQMAVQGLYFDRIGCVAFSHHGTRLAERLGFRPVSDWAAGDDRVCPRAWQLDAGTIANGLHQPAFDRIRAAYAERFGG